MEETFFVASRPPQQGNKIDVISGFGLPAFTGGSVAYPNDTTEVYTLTKDGKTVTVVTLVYTDNTKASLSSFSRT